MGIDGGIVTTVTAVATPAAPEADEGAFPVTVAEADRTEWI
jgi:hypothetical protein